MKAAQKNILLDPENPQMKLLDDAPKASRLLELVRSNLVNQDKNTNHSNMEINAIEHSLLNSLKFYIEKYGLEPKEFREKISKTDDYKMVIHLLLYTKDILVNIFQD